LDHFLPFDFSSLLDNQALPKEAEEKLSVKALLMQVAGFGGYALLVILLAGQAFYWHETRRFFYLGGRKLSLTISVSTFVATWMSAASLIGYTAWLYSDGYQAFTASVNGWLLGLVFLPFTVGKLRRSRALSLPEWLEENYEDSRLRKLSALALLVAYSLYIVIQFRVFGSIVSNMLGTPPIISSILIYLFVIYTTFGGLESVAKSDALNLIIIVLGITVGALFVIKQVGSPIKLHETIAQSHPQLLKILDKRGAIFTFSMMLGWGFGVASNPQYAIRIMSAHRPKKAFSMLWISALIIGWIYACTTLIGLGGKVLSSSTATDPTGSLYHLISTALPPQIYTLLMIAILAAAVSTANSQLLLATCSFCYDLFPSWSAHEEGDIIREDRFLLINRIGIGLIATFCLILSQLPLPGILDLGQYSWAVVSICFFLPMYLPGKKKKEGLFIAIFAALVLHTALVYAFQIRPEQALLPSLLVEGTLWSLLSRRSKA